MVPNFIEVCKNIYQMYDLKWIKFYKDRMFWESKSKSLNLIILSKEIFTLICEI